MPPSLSTLAAHALAAIDDFEFCLGNTTVQTLAREQIRLFAVERSFEMMFAALRLFPDNMKSQQPGIDWQEMADLDERLHDQYYCHNSDDLWRTAKRNLPGLKSFIERVVSEGKQ